MGRVDGTVGDRRHHRLRTGASSATSSTSSSRPPAKVVRQGDVLGTIESVKAVSEIYAPVSGRVREGNPALGDHPELVNRDPHGAGWYCSLELTSPAEVDALMDAAAYAGIAHSA